jgi:hypothetical protein
MAWDVRNPQDRTVLETARSWGVSPSIFMGKRKVAVTEQIGAQTVVTYSPDWTDEDRQAALELAVYEADLCPGCGHPTAETMAPENEFQYKAGLPYRCHRCTATEMAMKPYQEQEYSSALYVPVTLKERSESDVSSRDQV